MTILDVVRRLNDRGIFAYVEDGRLKTRSDAPIVDADVVELIRSHRDDLVRFLSEPGSTLDAVAPIGRLSDPSAPAPLSFAQQRLWFIHQLEGGSAQYNINLQLVLHGALDMAALQHAVDAIVIRHEVLRTWFMRNEDGEIRQQVAPASPLQIRTVELQEQDEAGQAREIAAYVSEDAGRSFDLTEPPLLRAMLLRCSAQRHVLIFAIHHIASDGWSKAILLQDFCSLYSAFHEGRPVPLAPLSIQYRDYAAWQRQTLQGETLGGQLDWWRTRLTGAPPVHSLPLRQPRPAQQSFQGGMVRLAVPQATVDRARALCKEQGITAFALLHAMFALLVARMGGDRDVVVGTPVSGRTHPDVEPLVGFFVNTVALRTRIDPQQEVLAYLQQSWRDVLAAFQHQAVPFEALVDALNPERSLSYSPLFQLLFSYHSGAPREVELPGLVAKPLEQAENSNQFDLEFNIADDGSGMQLALSYNRTLFDPAFMNQLASSFCVLLDGALRSPAARLEQVPLLDAAACRELTEARNPVDGGSVAGVQDIAQRVAAYALRLGDAPAARCAEQTLSFAELDRAANRLAHYLVGQGVVPGGRIGICLQRSLQLPVAMLAVLKAGAAYVPLDPGLPEERLRYLVEDAELALVLTQSELWSALSFGDCEAIPLDLLAPLLDAQPETAPPVDVDPARTAYVIYTSGSSGEPKGVAVPHAAALHYLDYAATAYLEGDVAAGVVATPFAFDATVTSLIAPWCVGKPVLLLEEEGAAALDALLAHAARPEPLLFKLTPAHLDALSALARTPVSAAAHVLVVGGEQLTARTLQRFRSRVLPNACVVNEYGPTETTVGCSTFFHRPGDPIPSGDAVPIGRPIRNTRLYVLDGTGMPVPDGVAGELHIGGAGVADGYLRRPALTALQFVPDPFADGRMYRSGDLVRWRHDGELEYLGRIDDQVKLNGFRIELGEIEAQLLAQVDVEAACVAVREDGDANKRLVAYVVPRDSILATEQDETEIERWRFQRIAALRAWVQERLPEYMQPAAYVLMDGLPLTANHKLDRAALPAPEPGDFQKEAYAAPRDATERTLVEIWQKVLRLDAIGIDDHFFRLGGNSLLATRLVSEIAERLHARVPVRKVFEHPTVRSLAVAVASQPAQPHCDIAPTPHEGPFPLSYAQQRLWFIDQLGGGSRQYHIGSSLRLLGDLDQAALQRALDAIVVRHEVLRTCFSAHDGQAVQQVQPASPVPLRRLDLSGLAPAEQARQLTEAIDGAIAAPFDLARDLMLRCTLIALAERDCVVVLGMHHIASDGWSTGLLVKEFVALYAAFRMGADDPLPPLPLQYGDFVHWQRRTLDSQALEPHLAYWQQQLAGIPSLHRLPLDRPRPPQQDYTGAVVERRLDAAACAGLHALAAQHRASLFMLLRAAFAVLLSRWSGDEDVVIASPSAGRSRRELEPLIGFFIDSLVLRTDLAGNPSFAALLEQVRQSTLDAFAHQMVPFDMLVDALSPVRSLSHPPLAQISLTLHNLQAQTLSLPGLEIHDAARSAAVARHDIELHAGEIDGALQLRWVYASALFDASTIERLADSYLVLLSAVARDPQVPVLSLPLLPEDEARTLAQWSAPRPAPLPALCAHELVEAHARARPEALAVAFGEDHLDYGALNAAANRVAHYLRAQGVGPDQLVALCVERSLDLTIGVLGILKAGAGYLPLDPTYPHERLQAMLGEAGVAHVLSQQAVLEALPFLAEYTVLPLDAPLRALLLSGQPDSDLPVAEVGVTPDRLAYAIFTSGSTGTPKGVLLEHRGLINLAAYQQQALGLTAHSRVLGFASASFDGAVFEWLMALASGASLHLCHEDERRSVELLAERLTASRITHAAIPPALLQQLPLARDYALELLIVAGERCDDALAWAWSRRCRVVNSYGPTEATVAATHAQVVDGEAMTLGRALPNVALRVLNAAGQPQPIGVSGQLYLGGAGLARGYLGAPGLTAERFVTLPGQAMRLYRTGDLARWRADGQLQFLGRADDQVKVRGFRIEPAEVQARLLAHALVREAVVLVREDDGVARLVAYVVCAEGASGREDASVLRELHDALKASLPDYMVPSSLMKVDAIPLTRNGKVDRLALPAPGRQPMQLYVAPRTPVEARLAQIWQEVLRLERIGVLDNFFEIGGDSILSIQVVSRAAQAGIALTTKQLFEGQTIAALARLAADAVGSAAPQDAVHGALTLLPIHRLFFGVESRDPHHYNQAVLLQTPADFDAAALVPVVDALYRRHDALRLRFVADADGWHAFHQPLDAAMVQASCVVETLPDIGPDGEARLLERCTDWQRRFDLATGPLLRAVHFRPPAGAQGGGRLLLLVHHAVVDGVSWRILLADLEQAYAQHMRGEAIALGAKTTSFQQWGDALAVYAGSQALQRERGFWLAQHAVEVPPLPVDRRIEGLGEIATTAVVPITLDAEQTRALLHHCNRAYRTTINELLLAGVYLGMRAWTGHRDLRLRLEGHGREAVLPQLDVTETVGYFTSVYPLTLGVDDEEVGAAIVAVKERYRAVPQHGIGYGVLRYLSADAELVAAAAAAGEPELEFNYLGQFDQVLNTGTVFQAAVEGVGEKVSGRRRRMHQLGLSGKVFDGCLRFALDYSQAQYDHATMQRLAGLLADGLARVVAHCLGCEQPRLTPSDFPLAHVVPAQLAAWQARYPQLVGLYAATPMQSGLHFESQLDPRTYVVQTAPVLLGALDTGIFHQAWDQVVQRHDILRTAFLGEDRALQQLLLAQASLPWHEEDWRQLPAAVQEERFRAFQEQDRQRGFDFTQPPLMRVALFRLGDERYQVLWTTHHIVMDGWSSPLVYRDVIALYRALSEGRGAALAVPPPFEHYVAWLQQQDHDLARSYWRRALADVDTATTLPADPFPGERETGQRECVVTVDGQDLVALHTLAATSRVTPNTVVQWAWAYLLHRYSGASDIVFGATVSGRPAQLRGAEDMVGLFINTLPVRIAFDATPLPAALRSLQAQFQDACAHGILPLADIQRQSSLPGGTALFDSLVVFENLPIDARVEADAMRAALEIQFVASQRQTQYALTLIVTDGEQLRVRLGYRAERVSPRMATQIAERFAAVLCALPAMAAGAPPPWLLAPAAHATMASWRAPRRTYARMATIHGRFEDQVDRDPARAALVYGDVVVSYGALEARANRVAHHLLASGVRRGEAVALRVERSVDYVVGLLGILKSGAAYLPLDPAYPQERVLQMLGGSEVRFGLTTARLATQPLPGLHVALLDDAATFDACAETRPASAVDGDALAFVMHTSGSTGVPKGVQLPHRTIVNLLDSLAARHPVLAAAMPTLQFASIGFDMSLYEVALALFSGSELVLMDDAERMDPQGLFACMRRHRVGRAYLPTAMLAPFAEAALAEQALLPDLVLLQTAGERLAITPAVRRWAADNACAVLNLYGPTESHVVSEHMLDGDPAAWPALPPIGRAIDNVVLEVLDVAGTPAPIGVVGELYIGGDGLALGYAGLPELTADRFVERALDGGVPQRLYRSGDLVRWRADGVLDYVGRADRQVKVRGFRIEPAEIEAALCRHPAVSEALVQAQGDGSERRLVAYVVSAERGTALHQALAAMLRTCLPDFMIPAAWVSLPAFPLTANGKVDRAALPAPVSGPSTPRLPPRTPSEVQLAQIWCDLLGVDAVGIDQRFFDVGGHSLLGMRMLSAIKGTFGRSLKVADLFAYPTIADLAQLLDALEQDAVDTDQQRSGTTDETLEEMEW
ncbi:amino acid adenylation domain-containing protein [Xanthomonas sacchari]|uniref:amino acid adenylation domain-containing protein n=1 Tax=Xanthomonas sacchari TaxID=56458 RepID=UPI003B222BB7